MVNMGGSQESVNTHSRRPVYRHQSNRQPVYEPESGQSETRPVYVAAPDELAKRSGQAGGQHHQGYDSHGQYQHHYATQTQARHPVRGSTTGLYPPFRQANERSGLLNFKRRISDQWENMQQFLDEKAAQVFPRHGPHTTRVFTERPYSLWIVAAIIIAAIAIPSAISIATIQNRAEIKAQEKREEIPVLPEPVNKKVEDQINVDFYANIQNQNYQKEQEKLIAEANNKIDDVITDQEDEDAAVLDPDYVVVDAENDYQPEELEIETEQAETTTVAEVADGISRSSLPKISTSSPEECKAKCEEMDDCNVWIWRDDLKGETEEENVKDSIVDVVKEIVSGAGASEETPLETESEETAVDPVENEEAETTSQEAIATTTEQVVEEEATTVLASNDDENVETTVSEAVVTTVKSVEEETTPELTTAQTTAATTTTTTSTTTTSTTTTTTNVPTTVPEVETTAKPAELVVNIEEAVDNIVGSITDIVGSVTNIVESVTEQPSEDSNAETTTVKVAKKSKRSVKSLRLGRSSGQCEFYFSNEPAKEKIDEENVVSGIVNRK